MMAELRRHGAVGHGSYGSDGGWMPPGPRRPPSYSISQENAYTSYTREQQRSRDFEKQQHNVYEHHPESGYSYGASNYTGGGDPYRNVPGPRMNNPPRPGYNQPMSGGPHTYNPGPGEGFAGRGGFYPGPRPRFVCPPPSASGDHYRAPPHAPPVRAPPKAAALPLDPVQLVELVAKRITAKEKSRTGADLSSGYAPREGQYQDAPGIREGHFVALKNIPPWSTVFSIHQLLDDCQLIKEGTKLVTGHGEAQYAYVEVASEGDVYKACQRDMTNIGNFTISVEPLSAVQYANLERDAWAGQVTVQTIHTKTTDDLLLSGSQAAQGPFGRHPGGHPPPPPRPPGYHGPRGPPNYRFNRPPGPPGPGPPFYPHQPPRPPHPGPSYGGFPRHTSDTPPPPDPEHLRTRSRSPLSQRSVSPPLPSRPRRRLPSWSSNSSSSSSSDSEESPPPPPLPERRRAGIPRNWQNAVKPAQPPTKSSVKRKRKKSKVKKSATGMEGLTAERHLVPLCEGEREKTEHVSVIGFSTKEESHIIAVAQWIKQHVPDAKFVERPVFQPTSPLQSFGADGFTVRLAVRSKFKQALPRFVTLDKEALYVVHPSQENRCGICRQLPIHEIYDEACPGISHRLRDTTHFIDNKCPLDPKFREPFFYKDREYACLQLAFETALVKDIGLEAFKNNGPQRHRWYMKNVDLLKEIYRVRIETSKLAKGYFENNLGHKQTVYLSNDPVLGTGMKHLRSPNARTDYGRFIKKGYYDGLNIIGKVISEHRTAYRVATGGKRKGSEEAEGKVSKIPKHAKPKQKTRKLKRQQTDAEAEARREAAEAKMISLAQEEADVVVVEEPEQTCEAPASTKSKPVNIKFTLKSGTLQSKKPISKTPPDKPEESAAEPSAEPPAEPPAEEGPILDQEAQIVEAETVTEAPDGHSLLADFLPAEDLEVTLLSQPKHDWGVEVETVQFKGIMQDKEQTEEEFLGELKTWLQRQGPNIKIVGKPYMEKLVDDSFNIISIPKIDVKTPLYPALKTFHIIKGMACTVKHPSQKKCCPVCKRPHAKFMCLGVDANMENCQQYVREDNPLHPAVCHSFKYRGFYYTSFQAALRDVLKREIGAGAVENNNKYMIYTWEANNYDVLYEMLRRQVELSPALNKSIYNHVGKKKVAFLSDELVLGIGKYSGQDMTEIKPRHRPGLNYYGKMLTQLHAEMQKLGGPLPMVLSEVADVEKACKRKRKRENALLGNAIIKQEPKAKDELASVDLHLHQWEKWLSNFFKYAGASLTSRSPPTLVKESLFFMGFPESAGTRDGLKAELKYWLTKTRPDINILGEPWLTEVRNKYTSGYAVIIDARRPVSPALQQFNNINGEVVIVSHPSQKDHCEVCKKKHNQPCKGIDEKAHKKRQVIGETDVLYPYREQPFTYKGEQYGSFMDAVHALIENDLGRSVTEDISKCFNWEINHLETLALVLMKQADTCPQMKSDILSRTGQHCTFVSYDPVLGSGQFESMDVRKVKDIYLPGMNLYGKVINRVREMLRGNLAYMPKGPTEMNPGEGENLESYYKAGNWETSVMSFLEQVAYYFAASEPIKAGTETVVFVGFGESALKREGLKAELKYWLTKTRPDVIVVGEPRLEEVSDEDIKGPVVKIDVQGTLLPALPTFNNINGEAVIVWHPSQKKSCEICKKQHLQPCKGIDEKMLSTHFFIPRTEAIYPYYRHPFNYGGVQYKSFMDALGQLMMADMGATRETDVCQSLNWEVNNFEKLVTILLKQTEDCPEIKSSILTQTGNLSVVYVSDDPVLGCGRLKQVRVTRVKECYWPGMNIYGKVVNRVREMLNSTQYKLEEKSQMVLVGKQPGSYKPMEKYYEAGPWECAVIDVLENAGAALAKYDQHKGIETLVFMGFPESAVNREGLKAELKYWLTKTRPEAHVIGEPQMEEVKDQYLDGSVIKITVQGPLVPALPTFNNVNGEAVIVRQTSQKKCCEICKKQHLQVCKGIFTTVQAPYRFIIKNEAMYPYSEYPFWYEGTRYKSFMDAVHALHMDDYGFERKENVCQSLNWEINQYENLVEILLKQAMSHSELKDNILQETGQLNVAYVSDDPVLGIGRFKDADITKVKDVYWPGMNLYGKIVSRVREIIGSIWFLPKEQVDKNLKERRLKVAKKAGEKNHRPEKWETSVQTFLENVGENVIQESEEDTEAIYFMGFSEATGNREGLRAELKYWLVKNRPDVTVVGEPCIGEIEDEYFRGPAVKMDVKKPLIPALKVFNIINGEGFIVKHFSQHRCCELCKKQHRQLCKGFDKPRDRNYRFIRKAEAIYPYNKQPFTYGGIEYQSFMEAVHALQRKDTGENKEDTGEKKEDTTQSKATGEKEEEKGKIGIGKDISGNEEGEDIARTLTWVADHYEVLVLVLLKQAEDCPPVRTNMMAPGETRCVLVSDDPVLGCGRLKKFDITRVKEIYWPGMNLYGKMINRVREMLRGNVLYKPGGELAIREPEGANSAERSALADFSTKRWELSVRTMLQNIGTDILSTDLNKNTESVIVMGLWNSASKEESLASEIKYWLKKTVPESVLVGEPRFLEVADEYVSGSAVVMDVMEPLHPALPVFNIINGVACIVKHVSQRKCCEICKKQHKQLCKGFGEKDHLQFIKEMEDIYPYKNHPFSYEGITYGSFMDAVQDLQEKQFGEEIQKKDICNLLNWEANSYEVFVQVLLRQATDCPKVKQQILFETGPHSVFVSDDPVLGTGRFRNADVTRVKQIYWPGQNMYGKMLNRVRGMLKSTDFLPQEPSVEAGSHHSGSVHEQPIQIDSDMEVLVLDKSKENEEEDEDDDEEEDEDEDVMIIDHEPERVVIEINDSDDEFSVTP